MTAPLPRSKPDPIPALHTVPEHRAGEAKRAIYDDTKTVLRVPWMGVVAMALTHYPQFWDTLWRGLRPMAQSAEFATAARRLRLVAESGVQEMQVPEITERLEDLGYGAREIRQIRDLVEVFGQGNPAYLLMATIARLLLEGHDLSNNRKVTPSRPTATPEAALILMEPHHADAMIQKTYADIRQTLGLPFVNTDYRALARWPSYFQLAWTGAKPLVGSVDHLATVEMVHAEAVDLALSLPNPGGLSAAGLRRAAAQDAPLEEVLAVVQLFQWLLPELVVNIACFRAQLLG